MTQKKYPLTSTISSILSILLSLGTATIFKACDAREDGTWMHCHDVQTIIIIIGIGMAVLFVIAMFTNNKIYHRVIYPVCTIVSVVVVFLPGIIMQMCMMRNMRCYTHMQPFTRIMGGIIFAICLDNSIRLFKSK